MKQLGVTRGTYLVFAMGILALWEELKSITVEAIWPIDATSIIMGILYLLTFMYLIIAIRKFTRGTGLPSFSTFIIGLAFIVLVWMHRWRMQAIYALPEVYSAWTQDIGSDGGLYLSFKEEGAVMAQMGDHWMVTYYRGSYVQRGDTLLLDIPFDFPLGKLAIIEGNQLRFPDSQASFSFDNKK